MQLISEGAPRSHGFHFGTFTRGSSRARFGDRRALTPGQRAEDYMGVSASGAFVGSTAWVRCRRPHGLRLQGLHLGQEEEGEHAGAHEAGLQGVGWRLSGHGNWGKARELFSAKEAMEALLAALGQDVVELDNLQVQRTECKVADKWKVELCPLARGILGDAVAEATCLQTLPQRGLWRRRWRPRFGRLPYL